MNGQPTKNKVIWQKLINVDNVKLALCKLKEINWLYKNVDDSSLDECSKKVIEVCNTASSIMMEKVSPQDVANFQSYTIRQLDAKLPLKSDIDQYQLKNVQEDPLGNRQQHLDVMCFPKLFPDGRFGFNYAREVKISASEYAKSRLMNKDSRFRKDPQYVFYLLWQHELKQLSAGIYNLLKSGKNRQGLSVGQFLNGVSTSCEDVEANLSTVFMSVRGTKQYWYLRNSELKCMLREYGSPTLFVTFSCAEYDSPDINNYLRKVNKDVPDNYPISRLCVEDPVSVSKEFSPKFHAFFSNCPH